MRSLSEVLKLVATVEIQTKNIPERENDWQTEKKKKKKEREPRSEARD
jgi:hypothetical protein